MKIAKFFIVTVFLVFITTSCSKDEAQSPIAPLDLERSYEELNITYGNDSKQTFDLYLPANRTADTKTILLVHGGGWSGGDKKDMDAIKDLIRAELPEMAVVNINYTLATADKPPYPMQINDLTSVIDYLKNNKAYYTISEDFGFLGVSAGAHLALLWSYGFDTGNNIKMVGSIVGPTNLNASFYKESNTPDIQYIVNLFGINATEDYLKEVSPYYQAKTTSPPTILFYGGQDPLVPASQGDKMDERLSQLGVTHEYTLYENAGHGWLGPELIDTWTKFKIFAKRHLP